MLTGEHSFPKTRRLLTSPQYLAVRRTGYRLEGNFLTVYWQPNQMTFPRLGLIVSRRIGNAVIRNHLKRLLREIFRQTPADHLLSMDLVVIPRPTAVHLSWAQLNQQMNAVWQNIKKHPAYLAGLD